MVRRVGLTNTMRLAGLRSALLDPVTLLLIHRLRILCPMVLIILVDVLLRLNLLRVLVLVIPTR